MVSKSEHKTVKEGQKHGRGDRMKPGKHKSVVTVLCRYRSVFLPQVALVASKAKISFNFVVVGGQC